MNSTWRTTWAWVMAAIAGMVMAHELKNLKERTDSDIAALRGELAALRAQREELEDSVSGLEVKLEECASELDVDQLRDDVDELQAGR